MNYGWCLHWKICVKFFLHNSIFNIISSAQNNNAFIDFSDIFVICETLKCRYCLKALSFSLMF